MFIKENFVISAAKDNRDPHKFYRNIYRFFTPVFSSIDCALIEKLAEVSFCYFQCLLAYDQATDDPTSEHFREFLQKGFTLHENAVKELAYLFPPPSGFWRDFETIKGKYFRTIQFENKLSNGDDKFTEEVFIELAKGKSVFCEAAISALCYLSGEFGHRKKLNESILNLHVGFQVFDDIDDFKRDITGGQRSYAVSLVDRFIEKNLLATAPADVENRHKLLFISGIAQQLLEKAVEYFQRSLADVDELDLKEYKSVLRQNIQKAEKLMWYIQQSIHKAEQKSRLSSTRINTQSWLASDGTAVTNSILRAKEFLENQLTSKKLWSDFLTSAGESTLWVTGYVGFMLSECKLHEPWLEDVAEALLKEMKNGSSFNQEMVHDADSTSFCVGFLSLHKKEIEQEVLDHWYRYQDMEGGWTTYVDEQALRNRLELPYDVDIAGWIHPHACVSAAAALILLYSELRCKDTLDKTIQFLKNNRLENGAWHSYWWTSDIYATSFALQALKKNSFTQHSVMEEGCEWLEQLQDDNGSWTNPFGENPSAFYTALAAKALLLCDADRFRVSTHRALQWLIENQMSDGSWQTQKILRIPSPNVRDPNTVKEWRKSSFGVNTLVDDHRRVFTTATVINYLNTFSNIQTDLC